jgi:epsin
VRQKAKDITNLLTDDNRLTEERRQRQGMRDRMANVNDYLSESVGRINGEEDSGTAWNDENELKKALAESKRIAAEEEKNRKQGDDDLEKALQISQQEALEKEQKKREALERENAQNLLGSASGSAFTGFPTQNTTTFNNPYAQQQQQQQPLQLEWTATSQPTGFNGFSEPFGAGSNPYAQQQQSNPYTTAGLQAQMTGFPSASQPTMDFFSTSQPQLQAQMTGFQQPQQFLSQPQQSQQFLQPQPQFQTSMVTGTNPFSQMSAQSQPIQPVQQPVQHDYSSLVFGTPQHEQKVASPVFASSTPSFNFSTSSPSFAATSTTTNNAFSSASSPAFGNTNAFGSPSITANNTAFNASSAFQPSPKPQQATMPTAIDGKYAKLNALLANKE